jgi:hypothetical protein
MAGAWAVVWQRRRWPFRALFLCALVFMGACLGYSLTADSRLRPLDVCHWLAVAGLYTATAVMAYILIAKRRNDRA